VTRSQHQRKGTGPARGDFRYTPRYQFWAGIAISVISGVFVGWLLDAYGVIDGIGRIVFWLAFGVLIAWFSQRFHGTSTQANVQPNKHPILALYSGVATFATLIVLDRTVTFALVSGVNTGLVNVAALRNSRRWRDRTHGQNPN